MDLPTILDGPHFSKPVPPQMARTLALAYQFTRYAAGEIASLRAALLLAEFCYYSMNNYSHSSFQDFKIQLKRAGIEMPLTHWLTTGAHSALSSLFHFRVLLSEIGKLTKYRGLEGIIHDAHTATHALSLFDKYFQKTTQMRHAISHRAELMVHSDKNMYSGGMKGSVFKRKGPTILVIDGIAGRDFQITRRGELLKFPLSANSYNKSLEVYNLLIKGLALLPEPSSKN